LSYLDHALVENRNSLIAAAMATHADGYAEHDAALLMLKEKQEGRSRRITVGADKAYDSKDFVSAARELNVTAHITKNDKVRSSNLDRRTTRHSGYAISLSRRWLVEKGFGWLKQTGPLRSWPPDRWYSATLNPLQRELYVFDLDCEQWRKLVEGINGNDVSWSSDSKHILQPAPRQSDIRTQRLRPPYLPGS
jgi:hypothetical protein